MASASNSSPSTSTALVRYEPTSHKSFLEAAADWAVSHDFEVAKFESQHLSLEGRLIYLAQNLPKMLPFPFSGVIAFQARDGLIVQVCHCPNQPEFTTNQPFNVLSIGKLFTATAVMQLKEDGKFSLNTPLSKLLKDNELDLPLQPPYLGEKPDKKSLESLKEHSAEITVGHLLSHTAGFTIRPGLEADRENWDHRQIGKECYSNYGYQLLARIIGKHTNCGNKLVIDHESRFRSHIEERIFKPAGMEGAIREIHSPARSRPDRFEVSKDGVATRVEFPEPYPHGNGCWRMTASDLLAFGSAIHKHHVLIREDSFNTMMEYKRLGFWVDHDQKTGAVVGYGHPGSDSGMSSVLHTWQTNPPITAVVLSNYSGCVMVKPELDKLIKQ